MQSRNEDILTAIADGTSSSELTPPQSREEALLMRILDRVNDIGGKLTIHICTSSEYDHVTGIPTILGAEENVFYLVPSGSGTDMYKEWVYVNGNWELFGSGDIEIPVASTTTYGTVKIGSGLQIDSSQYNKLATNPANNSTIKTGTERYQPITPANQEVSVFYGLAKAAGDSTQAASSNAVGTYTSDAKTAIKSMLGVTDGGGAVNDVQVNGTSVLDAQNIANIPVADNNNLGVVRPAAKTSAMTQGVGVDSSGALWTKPAPTNPIASNGIPTGGTTGQVLKKTGSSDYAAGWSDVALNDLSDVNVSPSKVAVLTYQPGIRKWLAGNPSPFQIGEIYEHYDEELQDLDGKGYINLTGYNENPSGNPVFSSYCYDSTNIHIPIDGLFEVYWTTNTGAGLESIYLIDRAAGTPFDHAMYRYDYDANYGIWVEAPLANTNEVTGMWTGTQAQYDAIVTKDAHKLYFIQE